MEPVAPTQHTTPPSRQNDDDALHALSRNARPSLIISGLVVLGVAVALLIVLGGRNNAASMLADEPLEPASTSTVATEDQPSTPRPASTITTFNTYETTCGVVPYTNVLLKAERLDSIETAAFACFLTALDRCEAASFAVAGTLERPGSIYTIGDGTPELCSVTQVIDTATTSKTCLLPRDDYANVRTNAQEREEPQSAFAAFVMPAMLASSYTNNTTGETVALECVRTPLSE